MRNTTSATAMRRTPLRRNPCHFQKSAMTREPSSPASVRNPMLQCGNQCKKVEVETVRPRAPFTHFLTASVSPEEFLDHYHYHYGSNFLFVLISLRWKVKETTSNYCRTQCPFTDDESFLMRGSGIQKKQVKRSWRSSWNLCQFQKAGE